MKKLKLFLIIFITFSMIASITNAEDNTSTLFHYIGKYSEDRAAAGIWGGQWTYGYIDNAGKIVIKPKYQDASEFSLGAASVGVGAPGKPIKYGFIDKNGSYLINPKFDETRDFHKIPGTNTEVAMVGVGEAKSGRKYGFVLKDGSYFVNPHFDGVTNYWSAGSCGYNIVYIEKNGKKLYGLLDSKGKLIIDTKYSFISVGKYDTALGYIDVRTDDLYGFYDIKRDKLIEPEYSSVMVATDYGVRITKKINGKEKTGFYLNGGKVIQPKYDWFWHWDSEDVLYMTELNKKYGLLGKDGNEIVEPIYDDLRNYDSWIYAELNGKTVIVNKNGKPVDDKRFDSAGRLSGFDLLLVEVKGKKGVFDIISNSYLIEPKYDEIYSSFVDGYAKVKLNGKEGIIGRDGKVILEPVYDYIYTNFYTKQIRTETITPDGYKSYSYKDDKSTPSVVKVKKDGKEFFLNSDFTSITQEKNSAVGDYDSIGMFEAEAARVTKGDKVGYVRKDYSYIVKPVWDTAFRAVNSADPGRYYDYFHIQKGGKWGIVFMDGTVIEPVSESMLWVGDYDIAVVTINGKQKYIKKDGKFLDNIAYQYAHPFSEGKGLVQPSYTECYFIDSNGKKVSSTYSAATSYREGLAFVFTPSGGRYIDHSGNIILGEKVSFVHGFPFNNGIALALQYSTEKNMALYGLLKKDGTWLVAPLFDKVEILGDFNYRFSLNGKKAEVTPDGKINWK